MLRFRLSNLRTGALKPNSPSAYADVT